MTMFSGLTSMFAQPAVQAISAGLLTGAVIGSTVVASGILPLEPRREDPQFVALLACPGGGPELARVPAGQQLLITGRSEDGAWLEVYLGEPGVDFAWAPAPALRAASTLAALPVSQCDTSQTFLPTLGPPEQTDPPVTSVPATVEPTPGPTLEPGATATPTPRPTPTPRITPTPKPTPSKTPTPPPTAPPTVPPITSPPDSVKPSLSELYADPPCVSPLSASSNIYVTAADNVAVLDVRITLLRPDGSTYAANQAMDRIGGSVTSGLYRFQVTAVGSGWIDGYAQYVVVARDTSFSSSDPAANDNLSANNRLQYTSSGCGGF